MTFKERVESLKGVEARISKLVLDIEKLNDPHIVRLESSHINRLMIRASLDIVDITRDTVVQFKGV